jgi:AcrR family transcriptional regulator
MSVRLHRRPKAPVRGAAARRCIDEAAYRLFSRNGIRGVGVDTITAESGVAKMTLYRHYPTKEHLALSFLRQRTELFSLPWQRDVERRAQSAEGRLLAVFDALDDWFRRKDYAGCPVIKALLETEDRADAVRRATLGYFAGLRAFLRRLAEEAGLPDPEGSARQWMILIKGAVIVACAGDRHAAMRAKGLATALLGSSRSAALGNSTVQARKPARTS